MTAVLTFREGCAQSVLLRLKARGPMTIDELYATYAGWPRSRVLRAVLDCHNDKTVALETRRGDIRLVKAL